MQLQTTLSTLQDLGCKVPYRIVINKSEDLKSFDGYPQGSIFISAKNNLGIEFLKSEILRFFKESWLETTLCIPYSMLASYGKLKQFADELEYQYTDSGALIRARIPRIHLQKFSPFLPTRSD